jgi:hypothetical protein
MHNVAEMQSTLDSIDVSRLNVKDVAEIRQSLTTKYAELSDAIAAKKKHDEDMAELAKLRQAEVERKQREENERLENERIQKEEQIKLENERKAKEDKERQERLEQQRKEDAERKERIRKEEEKLKAEREILAKERQETERLEKERLAKEQLRLHQEQQDAQRKADIEHRRRINATIVDSLHSDFKVEKETARAIVVAILNGTLKHLLVDY